MRSKLNKFGQIRGRGVPLCLMQEEIRAWGRGGAVILTGSVTDQ